MSPNELILETAERIKDELGVRVLAGENARVPIGGYSFEPLEDEGRVLEGLETLSAVLALCPEGFFRAVTGNEADRLTIELTGKLTAESGSVVASPAAVTCSAGDSVVIAVDASFAVYPSVIVHELCHAIDKRLDSLSASDGSHWNGADWARLNPEGFSYHYAYIDENGRPYSEYGDPAYTAEDRGEIWFVNRYSTTFPTEDRAVMMEALFSNGSHMSCMRSPHIIRKLEYYFAAMRYYFDPDGTWEETEWERRLFVNAKGTAFAVPLKQSVDYTIP